MPSKTDNSSEMHPLFPSGEWEGFYLYGRDRDKHRMSFTLNFKNNVITGRGGDDVGSFTWRGAYDVEKMTCQMTKHYSTHEVFYAGHADENGIWGTWSITFEMKGGIWDTPLRDMAKATMEAMSKGGFHIWPKGNSRGEAVEEVARISKSVPV